MQIIRPELCAIEYERIPAIIAFLQAKSQFFKANGVEFEVVNVHIPLPLQVVLSESMYSESAKSGAYVIAFNLYLYHMLVIPGYENRIVISIAGQIVFTYDLWEIWPV